MKEQGTQLALAETDAEFLREAADRIRTRMSRTVQDIIEIGRDLAKVQERIGHGNFLPWIEREFGMSDQTAYRFIHVATNMGDQIPHGVEFQPAVLYALAAPSTPVSVRTEIIERTAAGETVTVEDVRMLKLESLARGADGRLTPESKKTLAPLIKEIRAEKVEEKKERRAVREAELGAFQLALPQKKYGVIAADPEWKYVPYGDSDSGKLLAAENHFPTSPTEIIAARPVADIAADDCVLFLWATVPMLPDALTVMAAWGFTYKSNFAWRKSRPATGFWNRNQHELLLVGTRGHNVPAPAPGTQWSSVIDAPTRRHSEKPEQYLEMIEAYYPTLPKIELNRRGPARPSWDAWGNEAEAGSDTIIDDNGDAQALVELAAPETVPEAPGEEEVREEIERRIAAGELATIEAVETVKAKIAEVVQMAVEYAKTIDRLRKKNRDLVAFVEELRLSNKQALARAIEKEIAEGGAT
jgi:N6-adenosine-specific RNA methylase IME4